MAGAQPVRRRLETGIYERVGPGGERLGLEIRWKDAGGHVHRRAVVGGIAEARDALAEARSRRVRRGREPADPRITFDAVCDELERAHLPALSPNSQQLRRVALGHLRRAFGVRRISQIGRADVRRFVGELAVDHKANTVLAYYSTFRLVFSFARDDLDLPVTFPRLKPSELPDPVDDEREHRVLVDDELAVVLGCCESPLYFATLAETGCRASEALGLLGRRVGDGTIAIVQQLGRDGTLRPLKSRHAKRTIEIRRALAAELRLAGRDRVFEPLTLSVAEKRWTSALKRAGLADPQPVLHDLRHTHASRLIAAGWDPVEIARRLGDRVETVLRVYVHEFDARRRSEERRATLEGLYGAADGHRMVTYGSSQGATDGPKIAQFAAYRDGSRRPEVPSR